MNEKGFSRLQMETLRICTNSLTCFALIRFVRRFEREMSVSSTDSGVSVNSPYISTPSTPENTCTAETSTKQSKLQQILILYHQIQILTFECFIY